MAVGIVPHPFAAVGILVYFLAGGLGTLLYVVQPVPGTAGGVVNLLAAVIAAARLPALAHPAFIPEALAVAVCDPEVGQSTAFHCAVNRVKVIQRAIDGHIAVLHNAGGQVIVDLAAIRQGPRAVDHGTGDRLKVIPVAVLAVFAFDHVAVFIIAHPLAAVRFLVDIFVHGFCAAVHGIQPVPGIAGGIIDFFAAAGGALLYAVLVPVIAAVLTAPAGIAAGAAVLVLGPEGIARQRSAGIAAGGIRGVAAQFIHAAPFVPSMISTVGIIADTIHVRAQAGKAVQLIFQKAHLAVQGMPVQAVVVAVVLQIGPAVAVPLAQAVCGAVVIGNVHIKTGFAVHVGHHAAGGGAVHAHGAGQVVVNIPLVGGNILIGVIRSVIRCGVFLDDIAGVFGNAGVSGIKHGHQRGQAAGSFRRGGFGTRRKRQRHGGSHGGDQGQKLTFQCCTSLEW